MAVRTAAARERHARLVLEDDGAVRGVAHAGPITSREAYRWSCAATSGRRPASRCRTRPARGLHRALGSAPVGTHRRVGWRAGARHDVTWLQRDPGPATDDGAPPAEPR
jgi:phosphinothricin acetyltransferase